MGIGMACSGSGLIGRALECIFTGKEFNETCDCDMCKADRGR